MILQKIELNFVCLYLIFRAAHGSKLEHLNPTIFINRCFKKISNLVVSTNRPFHFEVAQSALNPNTIQFSWKCKTMVSVGLVLTIILYWFISYCCNVHLIFVHLSQWQFQIRKNSQDQIRKETNTHTHTPQISSNAMSYE